MNKNLTKSIGAVIAGLVAVFVLSYGSDVVLVLLGVLPGGSLPMDGSVSLIMMIAAYRSLYNVLGCYITAKLAPDHPMRHALALGALGFALSIVGAIATAKMNLAPAWYAWALVVFALPCAWLGGKLFERKVALPLASQKGA